MNARTRYLILNDAYIALRVAGEMAQYNDRDEGAELIEKAEALTPLLREEWLKLSSQVQGELIGEVLKEYRS